MDKLLIKRGSKRALEQLDPLQVGELFLAKDEERLYVGGPRGNIPIPTQKDLDEKATKTELQQVSLAYKESYDTLDDLKKAYPNGDVYNHVVLADGMIYTYAKGEWISTGVKANGVIEFMKAYEDLKVLGVGGRNLLRNSDFSQGKTWWDGINEIVDGYKGYKGAVLRRSGYSGSNRVFLSQTISSGDLLTDGETYTLSGWFYIDSSIPLDSTNNSFVVRKYQSGTTGAFRDIINFPVNLDEFSYDTWYYFKATGTVPEGYNGIDIVSFALGKNGRVIVSALKLEKGNKATDWTPAPEDTDAHPFVVELAETVFRSKQNEERIRDLEEKLISN